MEKFHEEQEFNPKRYIWMYFIGLLYHIIAFRGFQTKIYFLPFIILMSDILFIFPAVFVKKVSLEINSLIIKRLIYRNIEVPYHNICEISPAVAFATKKVTGAAIKSFGIIAIRYSISLIKQKEVWVSVKRNDRFIEILLSKVQLYAVAVDPSLKDITKP